MCVICTPPEMGNLDGAAGATSSSSLEFGREALGAGVIANHKYTWVWLVAQSLKAGKLS